MWHRAVPSAAEDDVAVSVQDLLSFRRELLKRSITRELSLLYRPSKPRSSSDRPDKPAPSRPDGLTYADLAPLPLIPNIRFVENKRESDELTTRGRERQGATTWSVAGVRFTQTVRRDEGHRKVALRRRLHAIEKEFTSLKGSKFGQEVTHRPKLEDYIEEGGGRRREVTQMSLRQRNQEDERNQNFGSYKEEVARRKKWNAKLPPLQVESYSNFSNFAIRAVEEANEDPDYEAVEMREEREPEMPTAPPVTPVELPENVMSKGIERERTFATDTLSRSEAPNFFDPLNPTHVHKIVIEKSNKQYIRELKDPKPAKKKSKVSQVRFEPPPLLDRTPKRSQIVKPRPIEMQFFPSDVILEFRSDLVQNSPREPEIQSPRHVASQSAPKIRQESDEKLRRVATWLDRSVGRERSTTRQRSEISVDSVKFQY